jgi:uncharacterized membrane protein
MVWLIAWGATALVFVGLDAIWLTQVSPKLYPPLIGEVLTNNVQIVPAVIFYLIFISGIVFLAVAPALEKGGIGRAALSAAVLGFVAYACYDLTNQATLKVWDIRITLADLAWGSLISAVSASAGCWAAQRFG